MADATIPLDTPTTQRETAQTRHADWWRDILAINASIGALSSYGVLKDERLHALLDERSALFELIAITPARTLAEVAIQVRLALLGYEEQLQYPSHEEALESAVATLERMADAEAGHLAKLDELLSGTRQIRAEVQRLAREVRG